MNYDIRWKNNNPTLDTFLEDSIKRRLGRNLQVEFFIPDWIQFLRHCSCAFFHFTNLYCDVWIWCTAFILGYQSLSANYYKTKRKRINFDKIDLFSRCEIDDEPVMAIFADHLLVPSSTDCLTDFIWPTYVFSSTANTDLKLH